MTVTLATFMEVLDTSIANVALPHIAGSLSAGQDESTWVLTSYLVSNAIVLPISAWASDRFGRKRFYMTCVFLFTLSSLLCGLSTTLPMLIFFRVLQGAGGGGLGPSEQAILADTFPPKQRGMGFAMYGMAVVAGARHRADPRRLSHRQLLLALDLLHQRAGRHAFADPHLAHGRRSTLDRRCTGAGQTFAGRLYGPEPDRRRSGSLAGGARQRASAKTGWLRTSSRFLLPLTVVALLGFVVWEMREQHPILNLRLLKNRNFAVSNMLMFTLGFVLYGTTVLIPQFLQTVLGYTAQLAGMALSPGGLVVMAMMPVVGVLVSRVDPRKLITIRFRRAGCGDVPHVVALLGIDFKTAMMYRIYQSVGLAFLFVPINTLCYVGVPQEQNNQISSMINLMRNLGGSFGISFVTTMLARQHAGSSGQSGGPYQQLEPHASMLHGMSSIVCDAVWGPGRERRSAPTAASME